MKLPKYVAVHYQKSLWKPHNSLVLEEALQEPLPLLTFESTLAPIWFKHIVTVHLLHHGIFLFSFLRRTHLLFGMYSYDWIHTLILLSSLNSSVIEL